MGTIRSVLRKYEALRNSMDQVIRESLEETRAEALVLNKAQLNKGQTANGEPFMKYRSNSYATLKATLNPLPGFGVPDLRLTGAFYNSIYGEVTQDGGMRYGATNDKTEKLSKQYGAEKIFSLNKDNKATYIKANLRPAFIAKVKALLQS